MTFDMIIGNPPYQGKSGNKGKNNIIWDKFISLSIQSLKESGYLVFVNPSQWRSFELSRVSDIRYKQIHYVEIHDEEDGRKTFNAATRYDWYVLENIPVYKETEVIAQDGTQQFIDLTKVPFLPNAEFDKIYSLVAKDGEEKVSIIKDSMYHTHNYNTKGEIHISEEKTDIRKYPCVYSISVDGKLKLRYADFNNRGHFGIPKVIIAQGTGGYYLDKDGKYALTQYPFAIVDDVENLDNIYKAITSQKFQDLKKYLTVSINGIDRDIIQTFRKDFYKDFL